MQPTAQSTRIPNVAQSLAASFDRVDRRRLAADVYHHMDETIFLVVLGAFAILYAVDSPRMPLDLDDTERAALWRC